MSVAEALVVVGRVSCRMPPLLLPPVVSFLQLGVDLLPLLLTLDYIVGSPL